MSTPAANPAMIEKALASAADVAFLDLEDSVAPSAKAEARGHVIRAVREADWGGKPRAFRMNALDTPYFYRDLVDIVEACGDRLDLIIVPKVDRPADVHAVATLLGGIERAHGYSRPIGLEVQIESAVGLIAAEAIAAADPRVEAIVFGPGDYAASVGMPVESIGAPDAWDAAYGAARFHDVMHRILVAGRAAGLRVVDGPFANFRDLDGFRDSCRRARALGYDGKWCIHPGQIAIANEVFGPTPAEAAWAQRVIDAYDAATAAGQGAITLDGKMIDAASIKMARRAVGDGGVS